MHAAVVLDSADVITHVRRLGVGAEHWIIVGGSGGFHRPQADAVHIRGKKPRPYDPIRRTGFLAQRELFGKGSEYIGKGLIQRAGLIPVSKVRFELRDPMGQLMSDHVRGDGETIEQRLGGRQILVPVAVDHLIPIPKGIVVSFEIMHT